MGLRIWTPPPAQTVKRCSRDTCLHMSDSRAALRRKYGKYLPHQRANVDQVPLPFVNDMDSRRSTWSAPSA